MWRRKAQRLTDTAADAEEAHKSPTNPYLRCVDIPEVARLCRAHGALVCIDSTFSTPSCPPSPSSSVDDTMSERSRASICRRVMPGSGVSSRGGGWPAAASPSALAVASACCRSLVLLEDVDAAFVQRDVASERRGTHVTFSGLLNALDTAEELRRVDFDEAYVHDATSRHPRSLLRQLGAHAQVREVRTRQFARAHWAFLDA